MPMSNDGLSKLIEETGELQQVCGKLLAYPEGIHPDGKPLLFTRLEEELADVFAAAYFVMATFELNDKNINERCAAKLSTYTQWHSEP